jgi:16S rRNA (guanine527-N7)-methyltransferase
LEIIKQYFPDISQEQLDLFDQLPDLYSEWNSQINVISRKDIDQIVEHHILHSLAIAKFIKFVPGTKVFDLGTGGGFPGIPLAIMFPKTEFVLADGTGKKIKVVNAVIETLDLKNVKGIHARAEEHKGKYDFVVSRAVAKIDQLVLWSRRLLTQEHKNLYPNGLIALKGGNIKEELKLLPKFEYSETKNIHDFFPLEYYKEKNIIYVQG